MAMSSEDTEGEGAAGRGGLMGEAVQQAYK